VKTTYIVGAIALVFVVAIVVAAYRANSDVMTPDASSPSPGGSTGDIASSPATGAGGPTTPLIIRPLGSSSPLAPKARITDNNIIAAALRARTSIRRT